MKTKALILCCILMVTLMAGCTQNNAPSPNATKAPAATQAPGATNAPNASPDAVATPSVVVDDNSAVKAMGTEGTWIIIFTKDFTTTKELVLEGEYKNGKKDDKGNDVIQRKIALYTQDANRNVTERFTLTAPKLTVTSPKASIQHGTFKGDLYVSVKEFQLVDTTIDGNVYFTTDEAQKTFTMDDKSKVTGKQELKKP